MVVVGLVAVIGATWIVAWHTGTQNSIGAAILITIVGLGVLAINWILNR